MRERGGLPIAVYLGLLVALALASAFVAVLAIVIFLPPRPPDVMRADMVAEQFEAGYRQALETGRAPEHAAMAWRLQQDQPHFQETPHLHFAQMRLAARLGISPDHVRIAASETVRNDVFVFRVRDVDAMARHAEHRAEMILRESEMKDAENAARERRFEIQIPDPPPEAERTPPPMGPAPEVGPTPPTPPAPPLPPVFAPAPPGVLLISGFAYAAEMPDGRWLVMRQGRNWAELGWIASAAAIIGATLTTLSLLAVLFARRLTRPIRNFSDAVQAVGVDPQSAPVREEGPRELRGAARAVNTMQSRLRALIADRTKTLAAVAHDMRTPLMRLRLAAEDAPEEQRDRMAKEIAEVEALVASFIAFARDDPAEEARVRLDVAALLQSLADDRTEAGRDVAYEGDERLIVTGQPLGLRRLFGNLLDNALKYGTRARIVLRREEGEVIVDLVDDGPGVPVDQRESVFEPFVRLNDGAAGAGLGLPAARSIARAHGGDIVILDSEQGALVRVTLPG